MTDNHLNEAILAALLDELVSESQLQPEPRDSDHITLMRLDDVVAHGAMLDRNERRHVQDCHHCQRVVAALWRERCPNVGLLFTAARNPEAIPLWEALKSHVEEYKCQRCTFMLRAFGVLRAGAVEAVLGVPATALVTTVHAGSGDVRSQIQVAPNVDVNVHIRIKDGRLVATIQRRQRERAANHLRLVATSTPPLGAPAPSVIETDVVLEGESVDISLGNAAALLGARNTLVHVLVFKPDGRD